MATSFVCPHCGAESFNSNDIRERYCGRCHVFVDDLDVPLRSVTIQRLIEEVRQDKEGPNPTAYNRIYNRHNRS
jgi:Zn-finger nucleic acid-binding protein